MSVKSQGLVDYLESKKESLPVMLSGAALVELGVFPSKASVFVFRKRKCGPPPLKMGSCYYYNVDDVINWVKTKYKEIEE